ncbi:MAG: Crp/Fnr family transcriptional regulator [Anaerolineales bacterium]|nr:Crp/Fnr family transcriptional regulator [Anaerolineales bacterium]
MITASDHERLLALYPTLSGLPANLAEPFRAQVQPFQAPPGAILFDLDGPCTAFVLFLEGEVEVSRPSANGREIVLYRLQPGDTCVLTLNCLLGQATYPARAVARRPIVGLRVPYPLFQRLLDEAPAFRAAMFALFSRRLTRLMNLVEGVAFAPVEQRLAQALIERGPDISATHQQLADAVGTAREVVSRQLRVWAEAGLVATQRGALQLLKPDILQAIAEPLGGE